MYTGSWNEYTYIVTGSSGSGKSQVCKLMADLGAYVVSADDLARQALAPGSAGLKLVHELFGEKVFSGEELNRKALQEIIFADKALKQKLEEITHPIIGKLAEEAFTTLAKQGSKILLYDCPLYFESKLREKKFRGIILVTASDEVKIARLIARDGILEPTARQRLSHQASDEERVPLVDFVIKNNGSLLELKSKVEKIFQLLAP